MKRVQSLIEDDEFFLTYGDGVADLDIAGLLRFHRRAGTMATVTVVSPQSKYGVVEVNGSDVVESFKEKPKLDGVINGGFFVLEPGVLDYIGGDHTWWEREPMQDLARDGQLAAYKHTGFWQCMDHLADKIKLEELWSSGKPPWKVW